MLKIEAARRLIAWICVFCSHIKYGEVFVVLQLW